MSPYLTDHRQHAGVKPDKFYKTTRSFSAMGMPAPQGSSCLDSSVGSVTGSWHAKNWQT